MRHWIGYVVLIGVFVLGAIAGGGAALAYATSDHAPSAKNAKSLKRARALSRKLDLDRDQERRLDDLLTSDDDESRALGRDVVERCGQRLRDHQAHVDEEIRDILRPEQRRRYQRMMDERRRF